ncbi:MAG: ATP-binding protein [Anaerolineae bacterium]|nr:ATP-binding protein [Anaerolineae bacterium]
MIEQPLRPSHTLTLLPTADVEAIAEAMVALANGDGGTILVGLDLEGRPANRLSPEELEAAVRQAAGLTVPPVRATLEPAGEGATWLAIRVPRSVDMHSLQDGRVFIRAGDENRLLRGDAIRQLAASKAAGDYEAEVVPGATLDDFDDEVVAEYIVKRQQRTRREVKVSSRTAQGAVSLLREIGALDAQGNPTVAGILLFAKHPQVFLPQSGIVFIKFPGVEPRGEAGRIGYGRREEINGPLARVVERAWQVILEEMRVGAVVRGLEREEVLEYPEFAVREALVNAVAHRDYRLRGRRIEVRKYADRMEIISPGGLAGYITLDNIVEEHFSRNPRIVQGLYHWGYIEELGMGIDRMIEEMIAAGHPAPRFHATAYTFTVIMSNVRERRAATNLTLPIGQTSESIPVPSNVIVNERQMRALRYLQEHGRITNRDYQNLCPDVTPETLRLDLADLVDKGLLLRIGEKRGTYYILK